ncbi:hypothetical protein GCM10017691_46680 [Pseudonocardia petroleophila]|uniref:Uncharacterized protein n=1 Tax=Pseudonocardia petroleophila TaxID=37331 RepID=A0A7G7MQR6_9PSEU|nr:hypothetical protein [Pseudonocardia petroleophila]QNG55127.1 hypothetical protein H6H00_15440 [Pseudonocardia petroleophila]
MNTPDEHDDRPRAVQLAEAGAEAWVTVVRRQLDASADHSDFYALGGDMVATLRALQDLARLLDRQVQRYGEQRGVYDDSDEVDPHQRLTAAAVELEAVAEGLGAVIWSADRYWNAISHIGVDDTPMTGPADGEVSR